MMKLKDESLVEFERGRDFNAELRATLDAPEVGRSVRN